MNEPAEENRRFPRAARYLLTAAAFVVVVAGMRAASAILVQLLLAMSISVLSAPAMKWLERRGVGPTLRVVVVMFVLALGG